MEVLNVGDFLVNGEQAFCMEHPKRQHQELVQR